MESWILTKYSVLIASVAFCYNVQSEKSDIFLSVYPSYRKLNLWAFNFVFGSALCALYVLSLVFIISLLAIYCYFLYFTNEKLEPQFKWHVQVVLGSKWWNQYFYSHLPDSLACALFQCPSPWPNTITSACLLFFGSFHSPFLHGHCLSTDPHQPTPGLLQKVH